MAAREGNDPINGGEEDDLTEQDRDEVDLMLPPGGPGGGGRIRAKSCWYAGKRYSPGSVIQMPTGANYRCSVSGRWVVIP